MRPCHHPEAVILSTGGEWYDGTAAATVVVPLPGIIYQNVPGQYYVEP